MAVGVAGYHQAQADPPGRHRQRSQRGPTLKTRPRRIRKDGQEMIEAPGRVVAQGVDFLPERKQLRPSGVLLRRLDTEANRIGCHFRPITGSQPIFSWWRLELPLSNRTAVASEISPNR